MGKETLHTLAKSRSGQEAILSLIFAMRELKHHVRISKSYLNVPDFIFENGYFFDVMLDIEKSEFKYGVGPMKHCYQNAQKLWRDWKNFLIYVEGMAIFNDLGIPMNHAWCVTPHGVVVDPTWKNKGVAYFGVPIGSNLIQFIKDKYGFKNTNLAYIDDWENHWPMLADDFLEGGIGMNAPIVSMQGIGARKNNTESVIKMFMKKTGRAWCSTQEKKELKADEMTMKRK